MISIEQILSAVSADDNDEQTPMTLRELRDAIDAAAADLVDDEVPVLVRIRTSSGDVHIGMLDDLTHCDAGGIIVEASRETEQ